MKRIFNSLFPRGQSTNIIVMFALINIFGMMWWDKMTDMTAALSLVGTLIGMAGSKFNEGKRLEALKEHYND